jgi:hypothetical protein
MEKHIIEGEKKLDISPFLYIILIIVVYAIAI